MAPFFSWIRSYWKELTGTVVAVLGLFAAITKLEKLAGYLQGLVPIEGVGTGSQITRGAATLLAGGLVLLISLIVLSVVLGWKFFRVRNDQAVTDRLGLLSSAQKSAITESRKLVNRLYPTPAQPPHELVEYRVILHLENGGDGSYITRMQLRAFDPTKPLHFVKSSLRVEPEAPSAESLEEIGFSVKDLGASDVAHLLLENEPRFKRVAVFFLPSVAATEEQPRTIEVAWHWPGMYRRLFNSGFEEWKLKPSSSTPVGLLAFEIYWTHTVGEILCSYDGPALGVPVDQGPVDPQPGLKGWRFVAKNAPTDVEFVFKLERRH